MLMFEIPLDQIIVCWADNAELPIYEFSRAIYHALNLNGLGHTRIFVILWRRKRNSPE